MNKNEYKRSENIDVIYGAKKEQIEEITTTTIVRKTNNESQILVVPQKAKFDNGDFVTIFQEAFRTISTEMNLTILEYKLFLFLISVCEKGTNRVCLDKEHLVYHLKREESNIDKAIKGLMSRNIILKTKINNKVLEISFPFLNHNIAFRGQIKEFNKDIAAKAELKFLPKDLEIKSIKIPDMFSNDNEQPNS
jgi:hypothetical protein